MTNTRSRSFYHLVVSLIFFSVVLFNLRISSIFGRGILITEVLILIAIVMNCRNMLNLKLLLVLIFLASVPLLSLFYVSNYTDFIKSYLQYLLYVLFICVICTVEARSKYFVAFNNGGVILVAFGFVQFVVRGLSISKYRMLVHNPYGNYAFSSVLGESFVGGIPRVNSLLYEPSIFGLLCIVMIAIEIFMSRRTNEYRKWRLSLFAAGVLMSGSILAYSGLMMFGIVLAFSKLQSVGGLLLRVILVIGMSCIVFSDYFLRRANEVFIAGTSGYYRIVAPIKLIADRVGDGDYFGIGLGQLENILTSNQYNYMLKQSYTGLRMGTTIDNVLFMLILTFGIGFLPMLILFLSRAFQNTNRDNIYVLISFVLVSFSTGGFNFIYFNIVLAILILVWRFDKNENINYNSNIQ